MRFSLLAAVCAVCACGPGAATDDSAEQADTAQVDQALVAGSLRAPSHAVAMVHTGSSMPMRRWYTSFDIASTNTVFYEARVAASGAAHTVAFEIYQPGNTLYQRIEETVPPAMQSGRRVLTFNHALPVAGTWIQQYAMSGRWQIRITVDDELNPAGKGSFLLQ